MGSNTTQRGAKAQSNGRYQKRFEIHSIISKTLALENIIQANNLQNMSSTGMVFNRKKGTRIIHSFADLEATGPFVIEGPTL
jgi:hypothetical protein